MNYQDMLDWHLSKGADITIATIQVRPGEANRFGIAEIDPDYRVAGFEEKPAHGNPTRSVFDPAMVSASMGIYLFKTQVLIDELIADAKDPDSSHDFGRDILPRCLDRRRVVAWDFLDLNAKAARYLARRGAARCLLRRQHGSGARFPPEFEFVRPALADPLAHVRAPPAKFVFARRRASEWAQRSFYRLAGLYRFRPPTFYSGSTRRRPPEEPSHIFFFIYHFTFFFFLLHTHIFYFIFILFIFIVVPIGQKKKKKKKKRRRKKEPIYYHLLFIPFYLLLQAYLQYIIYYLFFILFYIFYFYDFYFIVIYPYPIYCCNIYLFFIFLFLLLIYIYIYLFYFFILLLHLLHFCYLFLFTVYLLYFFLLLPLICYCIYVLYLLPHYIYFIIATLLRAIFLAFYIITIYCYVRFHYPFDRPFTLPFEFYLPFLKGGGFYFIFFFLTPPHTRSFVVE